MKKTVLVTGGAGFIGSRIAAKLVGKGYHVRVLDNLVEQVHGKDPVIDLPKDIEFIKGDVRNRETLSKAIDGVDAIFHEAAEVGVGQSMYEIVRYTETNVLGTAGLLELLANTKHQVKKLVVTTSMTMYGEGKYRCQEHGTVYPNLRPETQLEKRTWEPLCPFCQKPTVPEATDETKPLHPTTVYAINKRDQEEMCLTVGKAYHIPTVALRCFNVYGPGQSLSNPYTGVTAIFASSLLNDNPPLIYEDGLQTRDFVHVDDVIEANMLALERPEADYNVFNVGNGMPITIQDVARKIAKGLGKDIEPEITGKYRPGDIRHCYADIKNITAKLGWKPLITFEQGLVDLLKWVKTQKASDDSAKAQAELNSRNLTR